MNLSSDEWRFIRGELHSQRKSLQEILESFEGNSPSDFGYDEVEMAKAVSDIENDLEMVENILEKIDPLWVVARYS